MPHDAMFRALVASPKRATRLIQLSLPEEIAGVVDPNIPIRQVPSSFLDETGTRRHGDAVFEFALLEGNPRRLFVLLEHKSKIDANTPFQLLRYRADLLEADQRHHGKQPCVPYVLSVVFYQGRRRWNVPHLLDLSTEVHAGLERCRQDLGYHLVELYHELHRFVGERETHAVISAMIMAGRQPVPADLLDNVTSGLAPGSELEMLAFDYMIEVTELVEEELRASLARTRPESGEENMATTMRAMKRKVQREAHQEGRKEGRKEGLLEGRKEGLLEGRHEGLLEGQVRLLLHQLNQRFEEVPNHAVSRIRRANATELEALAGALFTASSVNELLEAVPPR